MDFMKILYAPADLLIRDLSSPFIIAFVFIGLLFINFSVKKWKLGVDFIWPQLLAFCSWLLFGANEIYMHANKVDIRIDMLFIWPVIMLISAYAIYVFIRSLLKIE